MGSNILCRNVGIGPKQGQEFCPQVGGPATVHAGIPHPPTPQTRPSRPGTLLGAGTPPDQVPSPPGDQAPPPQSRACWEIRSTSGWYASYWNAILFPIVPVPFPGSGPLQCEQESISLGCVPPACADRTCFNSHQMSALVGRGSVPVQ